ncbi:MAG TPA: DUF3306 domain-containing protein [Burkholderiales bacterium]|nr:DUF3306 domain-containing protein [Burkholderiales bacterium]
MAERDERFLSRWARLKQKAAHEAPASERTPATPDTARDAPPALPPLEKLTLESDYTGFFHPKVDDNLRRAALKRLFSEPHFNVMDGLDVYIDDYSKPSPLPAEMLATLKQAQKILAWAKESEEEGEKQRTAQVAIESPTRPALDTGSDVSPPLTDIAALEQQETEPLPSRPAERDS